MVSDDRPPSHRLVIPTHWTAAQADAVLELLGALSSAIFEAYEGPLVALAQLDLTAPPDDDHDSRPGPDCDDDIPF